MASFDADFYGCVPAIANQAVVATNDSIREVATGRMIAKLWGKGCLTLPGAFSPDGSRVVVPMSEQYHAAEIMDAVTGEQISVLTGHKFEVMSAAFSADGKLIVTTSVEGTWIWDAATGANIA